MGGQSLCDGTYLKTDCFRVDLCFDVFNLRTKEAIRPVLISAINHAVMVKPPADTPTLSHTFVECCSVCLCRLRMLMEDELNSEAKRKIKTVSYRRIFSKQTHSHLDSM